MTRPLRIEFPGAMYHITARGNRRAPIFLNEKDKSMFLEIVGRVHDRFRWLCYSYCLMENHYHFVVETPEGNLSTGMRHLNGVYTQRYNRQHRTVGHVFQGRYKAVVVDKDNYLLEVCRYVVLNPVRVELVKSPGQWRWSSYRSTAGLRKAEDWLSIDGILGEFGASRKVAQQRYREFVRSGRGERSPWEGLRGQVVLGTEEFMAKCRSLVEGRKVIKEVPRSQRYVGRPELDQLLRSGVVPDRKGCQRSAHRAHVAYGYSLKEIGDFLGVHYSTVSKWVGKVEGDKS